MCYSQLDRWAQLNVIADTIAKEEVTRVLNNGGRQGSTLPVPYNPCRIIWKSKEGHQIHISSHLSDSLMHLIQLEKLKSYWEWKKHIGQKASEKTDWLILQKSAKYYTQWKWLSKHVTGICGVGIMLQLWKHQEHSSCPRCGADKENAKHVLV